MRDFIRNRYLFVLIIILSLVSLFLGLKGLEKRVMEIMVISRIPRLLAVIMTGMSMSISGLIMQQISRNRFVSPTTAGTVDAAKAGVLF